MGILHRIYTKHAPEVWQVETRLLHAVGRVRRPLAVQWLVTAACDLHCPHCYSEAGKRVQHELTTAEAKRLVIDELVALGCRNLVLAGGELWLRRDIPELIAYAAERGIAWSMHTHGLHVPRFRDILAKHPPVLAAISLDDVGKDHDEFRGRVGSYAGALDAIRVLKEIGCPEVVAGTTVTRRNADRLAPLFPVVAESGADAWGLHLFAPEGRGHEHAELMPTPDQLRRVAAFARRKRRTFHVELCNEWGSAGADDWLYRDQPFLCGAGRVSCVVSASGEIMPCTTTDPRESEGNVRAVALRDVWATGFGRFRKPRTLPGQAPTRRKGRPLIWIRKKDGSATAGAPQGVPAADGPEGFIDEQECWLQSRNGHACSQDAFGAEPLPSPTRWIDKLLAHRVALRFRPEGPPRVVSARTAQTLRAAAVATVFLQGCATKLKPTPAPSHDPLPAPETSAPATASAEPVASASAAAPAPSAPPRMPAPRSIETSIAAGPPLGLPAAFVADPRGHYRHQVERSAWKQLLRLLGQNVPEMPGLSPEARREWHDTTRRHAQRMVTRVDRGPTDGPSAAFARLLVAHLDRRERGAPDTPAELLALLDAAERAPLFDTGLAAYLFHRTEPDEASSVGRRALFARLDAHIRVAEALRTGAQRSGKIELTPWRSKAAPPDDWSDRIILPTSLVDAAREALKTSSAATFRKSASVFFRVAEGEVVLHTEHGPETKRKGDAFVLERLQTLTCAATCRLAHPAQGTLELPAGTEASSYDLPRFLEPKAQAALGALVEKAANGDTAALGKLEPMIALAHRFVRARIAQTPAAPALPALQMLLTTLDE